MGEELGIGLKHILSLRRAACQQQAVTVSLQEDRALMTLSGDTSALTFDLSKVPSPEAAPKLQALTLSLAERVCNLERRLAGRLYVSTCILTRGPAFAYPLGIEWGAHGFFPAAEETATSPRKNTHPVGPQLFLPGKR